MGKTRTGKAAVACTAVAFVLVVIAFTTPNWLETDGKLDNPQFVKIGKIVRDWESVPPRDLYLRITCIWQVLFKHCDIATRELSIFASLLQDIIQRIRCVTRNRVDRQKMIISFIPFPIAEFHSKLLVEWRLKNYILKRVPFYYAQLIICLLIMWHYKHI